MEKSRKPAICCWIPDKRETDGIYRKELIGIQTRRKKQKLNGVKTEMFFLVQKLPATPTPLGGTLDGAGVSQKGQLSELGVSQESQLQLDGLQDDCGQEDLCLTWASAPREEGPGKSDKMLVTLVYMIAICSFCGWLWRLPKSCSWQVRVTIGI